MNEKVIDILSTIAIVIICIFFAAIVFIIIDFKNDYDCSTTIDKEWYVKHNCMRYER